MKHVKIYWEKESVIITDVDKTCTVLPAKSDSDVMACL